jgi:hypothetical protein
MNFRVSTNYSFIKKGTKERGGGRRENETALLDFILTNFKFSLMDEQTSEFFKPCT